MGRYSRRYVKVIRYYNKEIDIEWGFREDKIIINPFMGSGTTGLACKKLNRDFIGIEIDENYFNLAKEILN